MVLKNYIKVFKYTKSSKENINVEETRLLKMASTYQAHLTKGKCNPSLCEIYNLSGLSLTVSKMIKGTF